MLDQLSLEGGGPYTTYRPENMQVVAVDLQGGSEVPSIIRYHLQPSPLCPQDPEHPGTHAASHQDIKAPIPVQGVIRLLEFQEYCAEDRITHGRHMLDQLSLEGGGPYTTYRPENMQVVMLVDCHGQTLVNKTSGGLPQELQ